MKAIQAIPTPALFGLVLGLLAGCASTEPRTGDVAFGEQAARLAAADAALADFRAERAADLDGSPEEAAARSKDPAPVDDPGAAANDSEPSVEPNADDRWIGLGPDPFFAVDFDPTVGQVGPGRLRYGTDAGYEVLDVDRGSIHALLACLDYVAERGWTEDVDALRRLLTDQALTWSCRFDEVEQEWTFEPTAPAPVGSILRIGSGGVQADLRFMSTWQRGDWRVSSGTVIRGLPLAIRTEAGGRELKSLSGLFNRGRLDFPGVDGSPVALVAEFTDVSLSEERIRAYALAIAERGLGLEIRFKGRGRNEVHTVAEATVTQIRHTLEVLNLIRPR